MAFIRSISQIILAFILELFLTSKHFSLAKEIECPDICNKGACSMGVLMCLTPGLTQIPINPPRGIQKVIIKNQNFVNTVLTYTNLSRYGSEEISLKKLTIVNCQLTSIEPEAFSHLIYLQELDLSNNKLRFIQPNTFKSLGLKSLILDGNKNVELSENSFRGLVVNSLSMQKCHLTDLSHDVIKQISGYLTTLNLAVNAISYLSHDFDLLFRRLDNLNLEMNPFNCSCQLKWLSSTLQTRSKKVKPKVLSNTNPKVMNVPLCHYPKKLNGSIIESLPSTSFQCQIPKIKRVDIKITSSTTATLSCISDLMSNSHVKWRYKYITSKMFYQYSDQISRPNQASISVSKQLDFDFYSCLILNENGNATVDVKIVWPKKLEMMENEIITEYNGNSKIIQNVTQTSIVINNVERESINYLWIKQYTFIEMVLAIFGTFIITLVSFILLYIIINFRRKNLRTKHTMKGYEVGIYSESQTYDVPQLSPYHESNTRRLLDFKTQQEIKGW